MYRWCDVRCVSHLSIFYFFLAGWRREREGKKGRKIGWEGQRCKNFWLEGRARELQQNWVTTSHVFHYVDIMDNRFRDRSSWKKEYGFKSEETDKWDVQRASSQLLCFFEFFTRWCKNAITCQQLILASSCKQSEQIQDAIYADLFTQLELDVFIKSIFPYLQLPLPASTSPATTSTCNMKLVHLLFLFAIAASQVELAKADNARALWVVDEFDEPIFYSSFVPHFHLHLL